MKTKRLLADILLLSGTLSAAELQYHDWIIDGVKREALIYVAAGNESRSAGFCVSRARRFGRTGGAPVITLIHPGGHTFPREAPELIVRFFKAHVRK